MTKTPRYYSPGYLRAVRRDALEWEIARRIDETRARDAAARAAIEAEKAEVLAALERNKHGDK